MKSMKVIMMEMLALVFGLSGCRNTGKQAQQDWSAVLPPATTAARITMDKLPEVLRNVQAGRTEFDFTGICSNGTDCIYFMQENGKFYIDFEAMGKEQLPYLDSLKRFAEEHGYPVVETTYNTASWKSGGKLSRTSSTTTAGRFTKSCRNLDNLYAFFRLLPRHTLPSPP